MKDLFCNEIGYQTPKIDTRAAIFKDNKILLVHDIRERGIAAISLEATDMGRPLYEKYGFVKMNHEMELKEEYSFRRLD